MDLEKSVALQGPIRKDFLESVLKRKIVSFKSSEGSNPGDNYTSVLIALEVVVEDGKDPLYLLFKTFPSHPTRQKFLEESNVFLKEFQVYDIWLRELIEFQKSIPGIKEPLVPAMPELVAGAAIDYENGDPNNWKDLDPMLSNFLLMVDVRKTFGFKMADKLKSLGYHHVKVVFEELAKYHALGHAYKTHNKLPTIRGKLVFMNDIFFANPSQRPLIEALMQMGVNLVADACKDFLNGNPEISTSFSKFQKDSQLTTELTCMLANPNGVDEEKVEGFMRVKPQKSSSPPMKDQWIVPGQGDCWNNNMLFKTDKNGDVNQVVLVDLQLARESCITADLVYLLYTSTDTDFRKKHLDEMITWYHGRFLHFCSILKVDPFPGFTLENFQRKLHRSKIFGLMFAILNFTIKLQRPVDMDSMETKGEDVTNDMADMFMNLGRDKDDLKLLRDSASKLLSELYEEGVL